MSMKFLITGISGFIGCYLFDQLNRPEHTIIGLDLCEPPQNAAPAFSLDSSRHRGRRAGVNGEARCRFVQLDVRDATACERIVAEEQPDRLFHLAGAKASQPLADLLNINVLGTAHILEAVRRHSPRSTVLFAGSGALYGPVPERQMPITEDLPPDPVTLNGISKAAADLMCRHYAKTHDMKVIRVRTFNAVGPGQSEDFVCSAFARQLAEVKFGLREPVLRTGNLDSMRDFVDVRDVACGFEKLARDGAPGIAYNLCSGRAVRIKEVLERLIEISGLAVTTIQEPGRLQKSDVSAQRGSYERALKVCGWQPEISLQHSLEDLYRDWCERIKRRLNDELV